MKTFNLLVLVLLLVGCNGQELYSHLTEQEANEMAALLHNTGIPAKKRVLGDQSYSISAPTPEFARAVELLSANGYPRNRFESLGEVFQKEGFVSSPLEERARLNYAQSQELTKTLESIDGVVLARVHLAVPETDPLSDEVKPASASIFIKHRRGIDLSSFEGQIKALIVNGIEGLPYEKVTVAMFPAEPWPMQKQPVNKKTVLTASMGNIRQPLIMLFAIVCLSLLVLSGWFLLRRKNPQPGSAVKAVNNRQNRNV